MVLASSEYKHIQLDVGVPPFVRIALQGDTDRQVPYIAGTTMKVVELVHE